MAPAGAAAQRIRTRDVGFAAVSYDNGRTHSALTLNETTVIERPTGTLTANALLSLFDDARWSMQGFIAGSRQSTPLAPPGRLGRWFSGLSGELGLVAAATAQQGFMPTLQLTGETRLHLTADDYGTRVGAALARTFDGIGWRSTVLGELGGWWRVTPRTVIGATSRPMQLQFGDLLGDTEGSVTWLRGSTTWDATAGVRLGEADKRTIGWGSLSATWPLRSGLYGTVTVGSYPVDLIQGLPGGSYAAMAVRLPNGRWPGRARAVPPPVRTIPARPELPTTDPLTLVIGEALDSLGIREIRVWAPGVREVELLADFVDWIPVPLVRQPNGEWQGYYRVAPGLHRLNLRLDRREMAVPYNLARVRDDFSGLVGLVVVK